MLSAAGELNADLIGVDLKTELRMRIASAVARTGLKYATTGEGCRHTGATTDADAAEKSKSARNCRSTACTSGAGSRTTCRGGARSTILELDFSRPGP